MSVTFLSLPPAPADSRLVTAHSKDLTSHMVDWELADKGFSYDVVAVFGSQSTGKSAFDCVHLACGGKGS